MYWTRLSIWIILAFAIALCGIEQSAAMAASTSPQTVLPRWQALQHTHWVAVGDAHPTHVIYAFIDPNCPYCHALWLALRPYYKRGLQVRNVLVDIISSTSPGKAAAIIEARNPSAAFRANEDGWGRRPDGGGGIAPLPHPKPAVLKELQDNVALMQRFGIAGTPGLVFKDTQGELHVIEGLPDNEALAETVRAASAFVRH